MQDKIGNALEMLEHQDNELTSNIASVERAAKSYLQRGMKAEAKMRLRERANLRKRRDMNRNVVANLMEVRSQIEDNKIFKYSISAMSDVAREFNNSSINMEQLHSKLTRAQDTFQEYHDMTQDIQGAMRDGSDNLFDADDEELELELGELPPEPAAKPRKRAAKRAATPAPAEA